MYPQSKFQNAKWADKRYFLRYEVPEIYNEDGSEIVGAKDHWIEVVNYIIEDLNWLLNLPFYRYGRVLELTLVVSMACY